MPLPVMAGPDPRLSGLIQRQELDFFNVMPGLSPIGIRIKACARTTPLPPRGRGRRRAAGEGAKGTEPCCGTLTLGASHLDLSRTTLGHAHMSCRMWIIGHELIFRLRDAEQVGLG